MGKKPILDWDNNEIFEDEIKYKLEHKEESECEDCSDDEIREMVYSDFDLIQINWDSMTDHLTEIMESLNRNNHYKDKWIAEVNGFGWRNSVGFANITACNGTELLRGVLPDTECSFNIFKDGRNRIKIQNYHHDSPTGNEWYYIRPATKREVEGGEYF